MPIPQPGRKEGKNSYVSRCVKFFSDEGSDLEKDKQLAICYNIYKEAKKKRSTAKKNRFRKKIKESRDLTSRLKKLREHFNDTYHNT